ncbi:MAG: efflux RND transporter permease subunit [Candidatus Delongbacteria bacterium]|nr:efflux RND transporter permease subunit [Candidatus Delongbacteria bacterium]MCG2760424.1 efflux RND transporter permease subunit [Candidatus Delongbacteria bacterium]
MILTETAVRRPILTTVIILAIAMMGFLSYFNLPLNTIPEVDIPIISIQVVYPGASPEEIETNITKKIEDEVSTISGLNYVESYLMENVNITVCNFHTYKDTDIANQEIKDKINAIVNEFPDDALQPVIIKFDPNAQSVLELVFVTSLSEKEAYDFVDSNLKNKLARINGVSKIETAGGRKREISIVLDNHNLSKYMLSPLQIVGFLATNNLNIPGGNISKDGSEYSVKVYGEYTDIDQIRNIKIPTRFGLKYLKDIASIEDTLEKESSYASYYKYNGNGDQINKVIKLSVFKQSDANTVNVVDGALKEIEAIKSSLPANSTLDVVKDDSIFIRNSVNDTMTTIYLGILLTALVLYLFLHSFKITLIIAISMPITLISTFLLADYAGFSLNVLTLMALSVSVGTLVTNSVIIIENIIRHMKKGENSAGASYKGTMEIAVAVLASTLTNIVVFVPIATMGSLAGQMFKEFGLMVVFAMIFSILIGFTVTPMLSTTLLRKYKAKKENKTGFGKLFDTVFDKLTSIYKTILTKIIKVKTFRALAMILPFAILIFTFYYVAKVSPLGNEFFPQMDDRQIQISVELPSYFEINKSKAIFEDIRKKALEFKEVQDVFIEIGRLGNRQGGYLGTLSLKLYKDKFLEKSTSEVIALLSRELLEYPDANIKVKAKDAFHGPGGDAPIGIEVYGDDQEELSELTYQILEIVKNTSGTTNVDSDIRPGKPEVRIIPDKRKLVEYGTDVATIAQVVRISVEGIIGSKLKEKGVEYDIRITMDDTKINDLDKIGNLTVLTPKGNIKLSELAELKFSTSPSMITRKNKSRQYKVTADLTGESTTGEINAYVLDQIDKNLTLPPGFGVGTGFMAQIQSEMGKEFGKAALIAILLTFLLIAGILESYRQSFLIMISLPLSLIGVIWSLIISGIAMNLFAMMAGVMLIGIVVNNAILILDYANQLKREGHTVIDAIINACPEKMKAVTMATFASVFGMIPLAIGMGEGGAMRQGMGIVTMFGLIVSAVLTMFVIPAFYAAFVSDKHFDKKNHFQTKKKNIGDIDEEI